MAHPVPPLRRAPQELGPAADRAPLLASRGASLASGPRSSALETLLRAGEVLRPTGTSKDVGNFSGTSRAENGGGYPLVN